MSPAAKDTQSRAVLYLSTVAQVRSFFKDSRARPRASFYLRVTTVGEARFVKIGRGQADRLLQGQADGARAVATYTPDTHTVWIGGEP